MYVDVCVCVRVCVYVRACVCMCVILHISNAVLKFLIRSSTMSAPIVSNVPQPSNSVLTIVSIYVRYPFDATKLSQTA